MRNIDIDIDKEILENIDIDINIDKEILENIDIDIDIEKKILENIDIDIDIDKEILQYIDIDKISNRLEFGISNTPSWSRSNSTPMSAPVSQFSPKDNFLNPPPLKHTVLRLAKYAKSPKSNMAV